MDADNNSCPSPVDAQLLAALDLLGEGVWHHDLLTNEIWLSGKLNEILGRGSSITVSLADIAQDVHPDDIARLNATSSDYLAGRMNDFTGQFRIRHQSGKWIWVLSRVLNVERDADGKPVGVTGTHRDITDQKRRDIAREAAMEMTRLFLTESNLETLFHDVAALIGRNFDFPITAIEFYDAATDEMVFRGVHGITLPGGALRVPAQQALSGTVAHSGQPLMIHDAPKRPENAAAFLRGLNAQSFLCLPLVTHSQLVGVLSLADPATRPELEELIEPLGIVASCLALGIEASLTAVRRQHEVDAIKQRLLTAVEQSIDGIAVADMNGVLQFVNRSWAAMHGYAPEELVGKHLSISHNEEQLQRDVIPFNEEVHRTGGHTGEVGHIRRDNTIFPTFMSTTLLKDSQGHPVGIVGIAHDITERKKIEDALKKSERDFRLLVETANEGIWRIDENSNTVFLNRKIPEMLGYSAEEIFPKRVTDFMFPEDVEAHESQIRNRRKGESASYERRFRRKDGIELIALMCATPFMDEQGNFQGSFATLTDITERHRAEKNIREQEQFLRRVIDSLDHPFIVVNADDYRVVAANRAACADGVPSECTCHSLSHGRETPCTDEHPCPLEEMKRTGKRVICDHFHLDQEGITRHVELHGHPIFDEDGRVVQMIEYSLDITELDEMQRQLVRSESLAAVGQLAAGVAHEFNNVLAMISLSAERGLSDRASSDMQPASPVALFSQILFAADHGAQIVSSLLAFAQPEGFEEHLPFCMDDIFDRMLLLKQAEFIARNIRVEKMLAPETWVLGNTRAIEQVLLNMIINAEHAMIPKGGGILSLGMKRHANDVEIRIRDTGTGMTDDVMRKIFLPFFTTKGAFSQDGLRLPGTGLGLSVSARIIETHQGTIRAESVPGEWTEFTIRLPAAEGRSKPNSVAAVAPEKPTDLTRPDFHVLVVEDDEDLAAIMSSFLSNSYPDTHYVTSAEAALAHVAGRRPDVIVTDFIMPDMRADRMCARLPPGIPVVLATGWSTFDSPEKRDAVLAGFYRILAKPYRMQQLVEILDEIAARRGQDA